MDTLAAVDRTSLRAVLATLETSAQIQDLLRAYLPRGIASVFLFVCFFLDAVISRSVLNILH